MSSEETERRLQARRAISETTSDGHIPIACIPLEDDEAAAKAYAAYNSAGDPSTAGLNFRGDPCPGWEELTDNVRAKWRAVAVHFNA